MEKRTLKHIIKGEGVKLLDVAAALNVNKATVSRWCSRRIPAERVKDVSALTGIPKHVLRPDLFDSAGLE